MKLTHIKNVHPFPVCVRPSITKRTYWYGDENAGAIESPLITYSQYKQPTVDIRKVISTGVVRPAKKSRYDNLQIRDMIIDVSMTKMISKAWNILKML